MKPSKIIKDVINYARDMGRLEATILAECTITRQQILKVIQLSEKTEMPIHFGVLSMISHAPINKKINKKLNKYFKKWVD